MNTVASLLGGGVVGVVVTAVVGYFTVRYRVRAEAGRVRKDLENRFGMRRRAVYREFLLHLDHYDQPRPVSEAEAKDTGLEVGDEEDWQGRYRWERGKLVSVCGKNVLDLISKYDFSERDVVKDVAWRNELDRAMHKDLFPEEYEGERD